MRRKRLFPMLMILLLVLILCGTVFAYMFRQTVQQNNQFTPAEVACTVEETFDGEEKITIQVKNTGTIDAYLRVRLVSYWVNAKDEIVAKPSAMPQIELAEGWVAGKDNTYYAKAPVKPGGLTENLLKQPIALKQEDGYRQVVEVFAEAIQSKPPEAVEESWKVTLDENDRIDTIQ